MDVTKKPTHPLEMSQVRIHVALFLDKESLVSCVRVNRAWFKDFVGVLWHTVYFWNFGPFPRSFTTSVAKYGHLIRRIEYVQGREYVSALRHPAVNSLTELHCQIIHDFITRGLFFDIIRRNQSYLTSLDLDASLCEYDPTEDRSRDGIFFVTIDIPVSGFKLTRLSLKALNVTRANFSDVLQFSPQLKHLTLFDNVFYSHDSSFKLFQHQGIKTLVASLSQAWVPDIMLPGSPSLLVHFPQLETWERVTYSMPARSVNMPALHSELICYCPHLINVDFDELYSDPEDIAKLLVWGFTQLKSFRFHYMSLNKDTFAGYLGHQQTLTEIELICLEPLIPYPYGPDHNPNAKDLVPMIFQTCRSLEVFSAKAHQMDILTVENHKWVCEGLRELSMRFQGLDTVPAVDGCLERLLALRVRGDDGRDEGVGHSGGNDLVRHRICRKLLPLKKLKTVWLGTKNYYLAIH